MAVWVSGVLLLVTVSVVAGSCPAGRYGYRCSYQCHCPQIHCNSTSGCQSTNCSMGWSGPTCQKENIALNKTTSASGVYTSTSRAVDGDTEGNFTGGSCFHSAYIDASITSAWWRVDLGQETVLHDVIIYFRTDYTMRRRNGIQIYIADTAASPTDGVNCYNVTWNRDGTDIPDVLKVTCPVEGRYLVLYTTVKNGEDRIPILDFCEVEIEVCGPGTFGADCENYCHCDGDVCNYVTGVCPSGVCLPGWTSDRCDTVCNVGTYATNCHQTCSDRHCKGDNSSCDHVTGECAGGCTAGWRGTDCIEKCVNSYGDGCAYLCSPRKCNGILSCNHVTGKCEGGCIPGWKSVDCTEACLQGTEYGSGCVKNCNSRMCQGDRSTCPRDTGRCPDGCQAGWKGEDCTTACLQGTEYGSGCVKTCSPRMCQGDTSTCPRDTGRCTDGCQAGWKGEDCTTVCSHGTYGASCSGKCGQCRDSKTCHHVSGVCPEGCSDGWTDHTCTQMCSLGTYGANCSGKCGQCRYSKTCHHVSGACPDGCSDGWTDHTCTQAVKSLLGNRTGQISPLAAGFIGAFAMFVMLAVVAVALCLWRKGDFRMAKTSSSQSGTPETSPAPPVEVPTHDVLPDHDYTKLDRIHTEHYETLQPTVHYQNIDVSK